MRKFFLRFFLFFLQLLVLSTIFLACYFCTYDLSFRDMPPPNLSESYSFNNKMEFLRGQKKQARILANGSSMTLNNICSQTVIEELQSDSFLNTSSWGISMEDNFNLLKIFSEIYRPAVVIIVSNIGDFQKFKKLKKTIQYPLIKGYICSNDISVIYYYLKNFSLSYYLKNFLYEKKVTSCSNDYEYLGFDNYGTVNYDHTNFNINEERWFTDTIDDEIPALEYSYLAQISSFCRSNHIQLLFFQSPYRSGLYSAFKQGTINRLKAHIHTVENILKKDNHVFVDSTDALWDDRFFADGMHFNELGAAYFTKYCFAKMKDSVSPDALTKELQGAN